MKSVKNMKKKDADMISGVCFFLFLLTMLSFVVIVQVKHFERFQKGKIVLEKTEDGVGYVSVNVGSEANNKRKVECVGSAIIDAATLYGCYTLIERIKNEK